MEAEVYHAWLRLNTLATLIASPQLANNTNSLRDSNEASSLRLVMLAPKCREALKHICAIQTIVARLRHGADLGG